MMIRSQDLGAEIAVSDDVNLKPLIKAVADDAQRYAEHARIKALPDYVRPVFPSEGLHYHNRHR